MRAPTLINANKALLAKITDSDWNPSPEDALDLITYAATEDLAACTRIVLWSAAQASHNEVSADSPVIESFIKYFPDVVAANITLFADCFGQEAMCKIALRNPAAAKYVKRKTAVFDQLVADAVPKQQPTTDKTYDAIMSHPAFANILA